MTSTCLFIYINFFKPIQILYKKKSGEFLWTKMISTPNVMEFKIQRMPTLEISNISALFFFFWLPNTRVWDISISLPSTLSTKHTLKLQVATLTSWYFNITSDCKAINERVYSDLASQICFRIVNFIFLIFHSEKKVWWKLEGSTRLKTQLIRIRLDTCS